MKKKIIKWLTGEDVVPVVEYDDYFVSKEGDVFSVKMSSHEQKREATIKVKSLSSFPNNHGYLVVNLTQVMNGVETRKMVSVHRLVAEAYIPKIPGKNEINHIDGNRQNPSVENLQWCTRSENELHAYRSLGKITNGLIMRKLSSIDICEIKKKITNGETQASIAKTYNVRQSVISRINTGDTYVKHM